MSRLEDGAILRIASGVEAIGNAIQCLAKAIDRASALSDPPVVSVEKHNRDRRERYAFALWRRLGDETFIHHGRKGVAEHCVKAADSLIAELDKERG